MTTTFNIIYLQARKHISVRRLKHGWKATHRPTGYIAKGANAEIARVRAAMEVATRAVYHL